jgi:hypothetical protein
MRKRKDMESKGMSVGVSFGDRNPLRSKTEEKKEEKKKHLIF